MLLCHRFIREASCVCVCVINTDSLREKSLDENNQPVCRNQLALFYQQQVIDHQVINRYDFLLPVPDPVPWKRVFFNGSTLISR